MLRRTLGTALCGTCIMAFTLQAQAGVTYAMTVTVDSGAGHVAVPMKMMMRMQGGVARIDVENKLMANVYMLHTDKADTITTVLGGQQMAMVGLIPEITMRTNGITFEPGTPVHTIASLGDGPKVLGFSTKHYREVFSQPITLVTGTDKCTRTVGSTTDYWKSSDTALPDAVEEEFARIFSGGAASSAGAEAIRAMRAKQAPGVTLRSEAVDLDGIRSTMEVTELKSSALDAALFTVPANYQRLDSRVMNDPNMGPMMVAAVRKSFCR